MGRSSLQALYLLVAWFIDLPMAFVDGPWGTKGL
jgi:hypothetical protein